MKDASILVADDEPQIRRVLRSALVSAGYEVADARNGEVALEILRSEKYDLLLLDVNMPGMDGMAMIRALRADGLTDDISILMLTSEESVESETLALSLGADDYILKPVEPRRLAARVKALLARSKTRQLA